MTAVIFEDSRMSAECYKLVDFVNIWLQYSPLA